MSESLSEPVERPATCDHRTITTFSGNRAGRLWACADCRVRFYPACLTCVDVGHRSGEHPTPIAEWLLAVKEDSR